MQQFVKVVISLQLQDVSSEKEFTDLLCSQVYDFLNNCGITKVSVKMKLSDKKSVISAECLPYSILGSIGELEQLKRGLQTAGFSCLLEQHCSALRELFLHQKKQITADFIQDLFEV